MTALIRLATAADSEAVQAIYAPTVSETCISFEEEIPSVEEMGLRIRSTLAGFPWLVCEVEGEVLGYAYAGKHRDRAAYRWSVEVSVYVDGRARRSGIGRGLYVSLLELLGRQGYSNAYAGVTLPNPASVTFHESLGFRPVGVYRAIGYKLGAWRDVGWWWFALNDHPDAPDLPVKLADLGSDSDWQQALDCGLSHLRL